MSTIPNSLIEDTNVVCMNEEKPDHQYELIIEQVRKRMKIDTISLIERERMQFNEDANGYSFVKWLAYL